MSQDPIETEESNELQRAEEEDRLRAEWMKRVGLYIGLTIAVLWLLTPILTAHWLSSWSERGNFGDAFGSFNALFSGLAFAAVALTLYLQQEQVMLQRRELIAQRLELRYTRAELQRSAEAQERAQEALNKTMYAQVFKVALDILDSPQSLEARRDAVLKLKVHRDKPEDWTEAMIASADVLVRVFDQIGTLVRHGTVPASYVVESWAIHIWRNWNILEKHIERVRITRKNPLTGREFQKLYKLSVEYLKRENIHVEL